MSGDTMKLGLFAYELVMRASNIGKSGLPSKMLSYYKTVTKDSGFDLDIGDAVYLIIDHENDFIYDCYDELDESSHVPRLDLAFFALDAVPVYFPEGYTPVHFLSFCALIIGVAVQFHDSFKLDDVMSTAADVIQSVLTYFTLISEFDLVEDMPELIRVAKHCCRKLRHG